MSPAGDVMAGRTDDAEGRAGASAAPGPSPPDPSEVPIWGTKGIHFWALLSAIMVRTRPTSLLEFGGGRSTTFLADYAYRARIPCVSIEQSDIWHRKIVSDLRFMNVRGNYVHHVPIAPTPNGEAWYDLPQMAQILGRRAFDLVFLDGPQGSARRSQYGHEVIRDAAREARLIIVDDVQRPYNQAIFEELAARFPADGRFYMAYGSNLLAIGAGEWRDIVRSCFDFLALPLANPPGATPPSRGPAHD
jgi:hypothetical protein